MADRAPTSMPALPAGTRTAGEYASRGVILFWTYDAQAPSFRHRLEPVIPLLAARGWQVRVRQIRHRRYVRRLLEQRTELADASLLVLAKVRLSFGEGALLRRLTRRVAFDFDDALFVARTDRDRTSHRTWLRGRKFALTCRSADLILAGNDYLAGAAREWCPRTETVPTPIDLLSYSSQLPQGRREHTMVWIGRPENLRYLEPLRPVLGKLRERYPTLRLRVISSNFPDWPEARIDPVSWSVETETQALAESSIGLMPITDDDWSRGKCSFKLLQYMAAHLPCVASPVGMNREVVADGETGFLASDPSEWAQALDQLLGSAELRSAFGAAGRARVEERFDRAKIAPHACDLLAAAAASGEG